MIMATTHLKVPQYTNAQVSLSQYVDRLSNAQFDAFFKNSTTTQIIQYINLEQYFDFVHFIARLCNPMYMKHFFSNFNQLTQQKQDECIEQFRDELAINVMFNNNLLNQIVYFCGASIFEIILQHVDYQLQNSKICPKFKILLLNIYCGVTTNEFQAIQIKRTVQTTRGRMLFEVIQNFPAIIFGLHDAENLQIFVLRCLLSENSSKIIENNIKFAQMKVFAHRNQANDLIKQLKQRSYQVAHVNVGIQVKVEEHNTAKLKAVTEKAVKKNAESALKSITAEAPQLQTNNYQ